MYMTTTIIIIIIGSSLNEQQMYQDDNHNQLMQSARDQHSSASMYDSVPPAYDSVPFETRGDDEPAVSLQNQCTSKCLLFRRDC
jgi:hypothetical protein